MTNSKWVDIYGTDQEYKAVIIQALLSEQEIPVQIVNQKDSFYQIGDIRIFVPSDCTIKALDIIKNAGEL